MFYGKGSGCRVSVRTVPFAVQITLPCSTAAARYITVMERHGIRRRPSATHSDVLLQRNKSKDVFSVTNMLQKLEAHNTPALVMLGLSAKIRTRLLSPANQTDKGHSDFSFFGTSPRWKQAHYLFRERDAERWKTDGEDWKLQKLSYWQFSLLLYIEQSWVSFTLLVVLTMDGLIVMLETYVRGKYTASECASPVNGTELLGVHIDETEWGRALPVVMLFSLVSLSVLLLYELLRLFSHGRHFVTSNFTSLKDKGFCFRMLELVAVVLPWIGVFLELQIMSTDALEVKDDLEEESEIPPWLVIGLTFVRYSRQIYKFLSKSMSSGAQAEHEARKLKLIMQHKGYALDNMAKFYALFDHVNINDDDVACYARRCKTAIPDKKVLHKTEMLKAMRLVSTAKKDPWYYCNAKDDNRDEGLIEDEVKLMFAKFSALGTIEGSTCANDDQSIDFREFVEMMTVRQNVTADQEIEQAWELLHYDEELLRRADETDSNPVKKYLDQQRFDLLFGTDPEMDHLLGSLKGRLQDKIFADDGRSLDFSEFRHVMLEASADILRTNKTVWIQELINKDTGTGKDDMKSHRITQLLLAQRAQQRRSDELQKELDRMLNERSCKEPGKHMKDTAFYQSCQDEGDEGTAAMHEASHGNYKANPSFKPFDRIYQDWESGEC